MAAKHKCVTCKDLFPKESMIIANVGEFCGKECQRDYGLKNIEKVLQKARDGALKAYKPQRKKVNKDDLRTRKRATKEACHKYVRFRDIGKRCVSCGGELGEGYHCGHFLESGNNPRIRYDEDNLAGQCVSCNVFKGGASAEYRKELIRRIGIERVERLESMKGGVVKRSADDYREIEKYYKDKLKALKDAREAEAIIQEGFSVKGVTNHLP